MKILSLSLLFFLNTTFAYYDVQNWLIRSRDEKIYGLRPTERSQPLLVGDIIYYGSEKGYFAAIQKKNGKVLWKKSFKHGVAGSPQYDSGKIYFGANDGKFYCLNAKTGKKIWSYFLTYPSISIPVVSKGFLYITAGDNAIYALDAKTGKWLWQYKRNFPKPLTIRGQGTIAYYKNYIYAGFSDGFFVKLFALDGKLQWERRLNDYHRFIDIEAKAYVDDKFVIVPSYDGKLHALNPSNGTSYWEHDVGGANGILVKDGKIYLPTGNGELIVLVKETGKKIWSFKGERGLASSPVVFGNILYFGTSSGHVYGLNIATRKKVWQFSTGSGLSTAPFVDKKGNIYFHTNYGNFYSLDIVGL